MREVAGLAVWLASLTSAAAEGTTSEPFNCDWGRHNWHMGWSNPKKIYCCQHHQIGCEDHAPAQIVKGTSEPFNCDWGRHNWHMGWSNPKKIYCCQHHQIGCEDHAPAQLVKEPASNSSHAIPPWWVVAGVHPDGPETDYGPYRMAGFSVAQQRQFGVDATGHVQNWHRFTAATRSLKPCIDPKQQQMGLNQKEMMHLLGDVLTDAWKELRKDDPALQDWTRLRSNCQEQCMAHVLSWSLRTLWATGELLSQGGGASFGSVLADAVRTCYPGFRTLRADEVAHKAIAQNAQPLLAKAGAAWYKVPLYAAVAESMKQRGTILTNQSFRAQLVRFCFQQGLDLCGEEVPAALWQPPADPVALGDAQSCNDPTKRHKKEPPKDSNDHGLRFAARDGCLKCVMDYVEQGVDPEKKGKNYSALGWAEWKLGRALDDQEKRQYRAILVCLQRARGQADAV